MRQITVRLPADLLAEIDAEADDHGRDRSEHIRNVLRSRGDDDDLQTEVERLRTEVERLRSEKRLILEQREEKRELANYVESEQTYRQAPLWTRLKWFVRGQPA